MRLSSAVVAVLLALVLAAPAHAGGTLFTTDATSGVASPQFAGERLAWTTFTRDAVQVDIAAPDGSDRRSSQVPLDAPRSGSARYARLAASPERIALTTRELFCQLPCKYQNYRVTGHATHAGPPGQALARLSERCSPRDVPLTVDASGTAVVYRDGCAQRVLVHDSADGRTYELPDAIVVRIAGEFVATYEEGRELGADDHVVLREWRTGAERLRFAVRRYTDLDVQADGKVAWWRPRAEPVNNMESFDVVWASPAQPEPRVAVERAGAVLALEDDRLALVREGVGTEVRTLDGALLGVLPNRAASDFDGRRLAWGVRPCALAAIVTWDLAGDPPAMPAGPCPIPTSRRSVLRVPASGRRTVAGLACPAEPALGCGGNLELTVKVVRRGKRRNITLGRGFYQLMPGETGEGEIALYRAPICTVGRAALAPTLVIGRAAERRVRKQRVRLRGLKRTLARC